MTVVWLASAVTDLERLQPVLQGYSAKVALRAAQRLVEAAKQLEEHPSLGEPVNTLSAYRDLMIRLGAGGYTLRYRVHEEIVYVIHIRHTGSQE